MTTPQQNAFRAAIVQGASQERKRIREALVRALTQEGMTEEQITEVLQSADVLQEIPPYSSEEDS